MARDFDGSDDNIVLGVGSLGALTAVSMAAILRSDTDQGGTTRRDVISVGDTGDILELQRNAAEKFEFGAISTTTVTAADGWALVAASKAAGTATPRFTIYKYASGTLAQENADGTVADPVGTPLKITIGNRTLGSRYWDGQIAVAAIWNVALTDAEMAALAFNLNAWFARSPTGLWLLDQQAITTQLLDQTGGGANQTAITGTAVATQSVPVFSYGFDIGQRGTRAAKTAPELIGNNSNTGSSTIAINPRRDIQVGEFIVVMLSERDWGISSLADNSAQAGAANTYTQNVLKNFQDPFVYVYSCKVTRTILGTDAITATFGGPNGGKGMTVLVLPEAAASSQFDKSITMHASNQSTYWTNATAATAQADEYAVGMCAFSLSSVPAGTITMDAPWSLVYAAAQTGYAVVAGYTTLTAIGTPEMTGGWGATHDGQQEGVIATYRATVAAAAADDTFPYVGAGYYPT